MTAPQLYPVRFAVEDLARAERQLKAAAFRVALLAWGDARHLLGQASMFEAAQTSEGRSALDTATRMATAVGEDLARIAAPGRANPADVIDVLVKGLAPMTRRERDPAAVHQAMQDAPHDGQPYRQARAAIAATRPTIEEIEDRARNIATVALALFDIRDRPEQ